MLKYSGAHEMSCGIGDTPPEAKQPAASNIAIKRAYFMASRRAM